MYVLHGGKGKLIPAALTRDDALMLRKEASTLSNRKNCLTVNYISIN